MKQLKKTLLTLVALLAVTTGAWAQTDVSTFADLQRGQGEEYNLKALPSALSFDSEYSSGGRQGTT